jgi:hypothetical protein
MAMDSPILATWLPIIGRTLAGQYLHTALPANATIAEKARTLEALGLDRKDIAAMLNTTTASITELLRLAKIKKGKKKNAKKK